MLRRSKCTVTFLAAAMIAGCSYKDDIQQISRDVARNSTINESILELQKASAREASRKRITFVSPLDGRLVSVAEVGTSFSAALSTSQNRFAILRGGGSRSDIASKLEEMLEPSSQDLIFVVRSDLLDLQLIEENRRIDTARKRLNLAIQQLGLERELEPSQSELDKSRAAIRSIDADAFYERHRFSRRRCDLPNDACLGNDKALRHRATVRSQNEAEARIVTDRRSFKIEQELPTQIAAARADLASAETSLALLEATARVGEVTCPQTCLIVDFHAVEGQFVTKGDPIVTVEFLGPNTRASGSSGDPAEQSVGEGGAP